MPRTNRNPTYRLHKPTGQAVVTLSGRTFYLGTHGTDASKREYDRLIAEWLTQGREIHDGGAAMTVAEVVNAFRKHAEGYYVKNGEQTSEIHNLKLALQPLLKLYGDAAVRDFGPLALKAVREEMARRGIVRTNINRHIRRVKLVFKWATENELVPPSVYHGLQAVAGLRKGRTPGVVESDPVRPVPDAFVDAIKPHVSRQVWACVELQRLTGMRSGEVLTMRTCDIDTTGEIWEYRPAEHKTEHHEKQRMIPLGPRAQEVLKPFLKPDLAAPLFSPRDASRERWDRCKVHRRPNQKPNRRRTYRRMGNMYSIISYRRAIVEACKKADAAERAKHPDARPDEVFVPQWHPHQLRHNYGTMVRKRFGIELARAALGHSSTQMAELYAELDAAKATAVAKEVG